MAIGSIVLLVGCSVSILERKTPAAYDRDVLVAYLCAQNGVGAQTYLRVVDLGIVRETREIQKAQEDARRTCPAPPTAPVPTPMPSPSPSPAQ